jgi:hypothetical protein
MRDYNGKYQVRSFASIGMMEYWKSGLRLGENNSMLG